MTTGQDEVNLINQLISQLAADFTTLSTELANQDNPAVDTALASMQNTVNQFNQLASGGTPTAGSTGASNPAETTPPSS